MVVLHADELVPPVLLRVALQALEFQSRHGARANITHPPLFHDVVERAHDLGSRCCAVQPVDLKHVDVGAQAPDRVLHDVEDVLA